MPARVPHLAIVGPTAVGKSQLALDLARTCGDCEIVSLDSMQVYRGLDIGTAKATPAERAEIPHHLLDVVDCSESWSVVRAQREARAAVAAIEARGNRAILVGGTGLYVQAVLDEFTVPGEDLAIRAQLEADTSAPGGLAAAWAELCAADPVAAARIDEHNQRRIVRALEVIRSTGRPFSSFGPGVFGERAHTTAFPVLLVGLWAPRARATAAIRSRLAAMRSAGLVAEVDRVAARLSPTAAQAIGYKELLAAGRTAPELDDAFELIARRTRSFARRQRMWFRRDPRIVWVAADPRNPTGPTRTVLACWRPT